jgi:dTDP-4-dehydrorhamnose 3,5-epimerase-like enzyme
MTHDEYTEMVDNGTWPEERLVPLDEPFVNSNGLIQNLLLKPSNSVTIIHSQKGAVRANHYHKTDWHYAYIISGSLLYFERKVGSSEIPDPIQFGVGQLFFTPPMIEHAMVYLNDTVMITMAKNIRSHELHEIDVERVSFITSEMLTKLIK